jgi:hypothetical protein
MEGRADDIVTILTSGAFISARNFCLAGGAQKLMRTRSVQCLPAKSHTATRG